MLCGRPLGQTFFGMWYMVPSLALLSLGQHSGKEGSGEQDPGILGALGIEWVGGNQATKRWSMKLRGCAFGEWGHRGNRSRWGNPGCQSSMKHLPFFLT